jgi:hypothetical protein
LELSYYERNKEACKARMREYQKRNKERLREYQKAYNKKNKAKSDMRNKIYYQINKDYYNEYYSKKYHSDKKFSLTKRLYSLIRQSILKNKSGWIWEKYVGYTLKDLVTHLKTTLPIGYTWNDYLNGKLELDHIMPVSAFDYESPNDYEFQECWRLENLRLVTPKENHEKGSKILCELEESYT